MKVIDKSDREILLDLMKLPSNIKDYDIDEQFYFIHEIINILEKSVFMDDYSLEHSNYTLSSTQDSAYQNALRNFQTRDYLNVYFEIVKFIENDGNKENRKIYEVEMNNIKSILVGINKKIKESTDLSKAFHKLVDKLNINSDFIFWIGDGNISPIHRDKYKEITLRDNQISVDWLGKEKIFQDDNIVTQIKEVIVKNKEKIYDFYERQKSESGEFPGEQLLIGTYSDECNGSIDSLNFSVCNRFQNEELNEFYKKFKNELFDIIEKYISVYPNSNNHSIKLDNNFNFYLTDGSMIDEDNKRTIDLEGNNIKIYWNRSITNIINCPRIANELRKIISKYEEPISKYAKIASEDITFTGTLVDACNIIINNKEYTINALENIEVNDIFYDKMKNEIYSFIKTMSYYDYSVIRKTCIDKSGHKYGETTIRGKLETDNNLKLSELLDLDNNTEQEEYTNTNTYKDDINEKYNGVSGIISIKNILIK